MEDGSPEVESRDWMVELLVESPVEEDDGSRMRLQREGRRGSAWGFVLGIWSGVATSSFQ